ncbi:MAG: hypothetical protein IKY59_01065 [Oscillospiraceae bacterium]|nr:hypothetical protein [Oscillospiraceae bacterium]
MNLIHKITAGVLVAVLLVLMMPFSAKAEAGTPKEEVVYVNLNADGSVKEIHVVNIFELDADGKIIDYGKYESLRNMTTTDEIGYANETITIDAKAGRLYYEGKLSTNVMPWNVSVRYYMNGMEYTADEIAGKSGDLKITLQITKNEDCAGNFFEGMALQTTLSLDTKSCSDIRADGATMANVGSKKQMTFTILPGKGADVTVTAKVKDFAFDGISINAVKLKLNIEIDDDTIQDKIGQILDAVKDVDTGAGQIQEGMSQLQGGATEIYDKVGEMNNGAGALLGGSGALADGLSQIAGNSAQLMDGAMQVYQGLCSAAEMVINEKLASYGMEAIKLTPKNYSQVLKDLLKVIGGENVYELAYEKALEMVTEQVEKRQYELYLGYLATIAETVYMTYLTSIAQELYEMAAAMVIKGELVANGFSEEGADKFLETTRGLEMIAEAVAEMTSEQKQQVIDTVYATLTDEQKQQILEGAVESMTDDQKRQIREGYIEQMMKSKEVTDQIAEAVANSGPAAASIASLMGQLDNYSVFYDGLKSYTDAVDEALSGANKLKLNMETLHKAVGTLHTALGTLRDGANDLLEGSTDLKDGTNQFLEEVAGSENEIGGMVNSIVDSFSGSNVELGSFVSEKNTQVESVQFVIKTAAVNADQAEMETPVVVERLTFWQKLLRLFGLY